MATFYMRQVDDNTTTMFETVYANFQRNFSLWSGSPAFVDLVSRLGAGIGIIRQRQGEQTENGKTQKKQDVREVVEKLVFKIGWQLSALASKNNDPELGAKVNFDKSTVDRMSVSDLLTLAKTVQTEGNANAKVLISDYQIPEADFGGLTEAIKALSDMKDAPRLAITDKRSRLVPAAIGYVRGLLRNEADKMMEIFRDTQPDFYVSHFAARVVIDRPAT